MDSRSLDARATARWRDALRSSEGDGWRFTRNEYLVKRTPSHIGLLFAEVDGNVVYPHARVMSKALAITEEGFRLNPINDLSRWHWYARLDGVSDGAFGPGLASDSGMSDPEVMKGLQDVIRGALQPGCERRMDDLVLLEDYRRHLSPPARPGSYRNYVRCGLLAYALGLPSVQQECISAIRQGIDEGTLDMLDESMLAQDLAALQGPVGTN